MNEVIFTSSSGDAVVSINAWDSRTLTKLMSYRGGGVMNPKGLSLLGSDYLIGVEKLKPILQVWPINSQTPLHSIRLVCPGKVNVMSCSPDSCYIGLAIDEKLHIYQVSSGCLVGSGVRHFQSITVIRWTYDGSILACGGEDGMITVWSLSSLLNKESKQIASDPCYIFNDHSLPVTDLILTCGGSSCFRCRLISVSSDRTCKIYDLASGNVLLSVVFPEMLTSVSITPTEMEIFVGSTNGDINKFSLRNPKNVTSPEVHISAGLLRGDNDIVNVYSGHVKSVTCLSVSIDGERLLSGSLDESVRIWDIISKQCLKMFNLKGPVTNAFFVIAPKQMLERDIKRNIVLCSFQKTQVSNEEDSEHCLQIVNYKDLDVSLYDTCTYDNENSARKSQVLSNGFVYNKSSNDEVKRLRSINERLYKISVKQLMEKRTNRAELNDTVKDDDDGDDEMKFSNDTRNVIENIFDNLIGYQKQPELRNKVKKKKKNTNVMKEKEAIDVLRRKSKTKNRRSKNKTKHN